MKNKVLLIMAGLVLALAQCTPLDENDYSLIYDTSFIKYTAMVRFVDAADPNKELDNVQLEVGGVDGKYIVDSGGSRKLRVNSGGITLALDPAREVTEGNPASFRLKASLDGYLPINEMIFFQEGEEQQIIELYLIDANNPPAGIANSVTSESINNGVSTSTIQLNVAPGGSKVVGASLSIPSGTEFRDVNGNLIQGGNLEVSMTHFDPNGETSVNSFPGGFTPDTVLNENGEPEDGFFNTAGFASINMEVGGTAVREFSQPIDVTMGVDPQTNNLDGNAVQIGDTIPIWSYEVETGQWQYEKTGTVVDDGAGGMEMVFQTDHLSWYNIDYYGRRCNWRQRARVSVTMPGFSNYSNGKWLFGELVFASNNQPVSYYASRTYRLFDGETLNFMNAPNATLKFRVYDGSSRYNKGNLIAESAPFNACSGVGSVTVNLPPPTIVTIDVTGKCPDDNSVTFKPNFYVFYKKTSDPWYSYLTYLNKGAGSTTKLELGQEYDFMVWFNGERFFMTGVIDRTLYNDSVELDGDACSVIGN